VTFRKYLVLAGVTLCASIGDSLLSRGMKQLGGIPLNHFSDLILAVLNPSVALGILLLLGFFASYMTALSWADLTYVLPATSLGYVLLTLIAKFYLHETVTTSRWIGVRSLMAVAIPGAEGAAALSARAAPAKPRQHRNTAKHLRN